MPITDHQRKLLERNTIDIWGTINRDTTMYVREALQVLFLRDSPTVTITICSSGGNAEAGLDIYDLIRFYPGKSVGIALIAAGSAACTILQGCTKRVATPNAHILIHHTKFEIAWDVLTDDTKRAEFIKSKEHFLNSKQILAKRTNKDLDVIFKKCEDDNWIPAKEALEFGLLDEIIERVEDVKFPEGPA